MRLTILILFTTAALLGAARPSAAGEKIDALKGTISTVRTTLAETNFTDPKAQGKANGAEEKLSEASALLGNFDARSLKKALKAIGKAMSLMEKAAKLESREVVTTFVVGAVQNLWQSSSAPFLPGLVAEPGPPEDEALMAKLGRKIASALKLSARGKLAKAVKKLAKAVPALLALKPDI